MLYPGMPEAARVAMVQMEIDRGSDMLFDAIAKASLDDIAWLEAIVSAHQAFSDEQITNLGKVQTALEERRQILDQQEVTKPTQERSPNAERIAETDAHFRRLIDMARRQKRTGVPIKDAAAQKNAAAIVQLEQAWGEIETQADTDMLQLILSQLQDTQTTSPFLQPLGDISNSDRGRDMLRDAIINMIEARLGVDS